MTGRDAAAWQATSVSPAGAGRPAPSSAALDAVQLRADGLVGVYAHRVLDRGGDLRALAAEARAARFGASAVGTERDIRAMAALPVGRGTERHRRSLQAQGPSRRQAKPAGAPSSRAPRRLVAAGLAALLALPFAALIARAAAPDISVTALARRPIEATRIGALPSANAELSRLARIAP